MMVIKGMLSTEGEFLPFQDEGLYRMYYNENIQLSKL